MIKKEREVKSKRGGPFCKKKNKGRGPFRQRAPDKLAGPYGTFFQESGNGEICFLQE